MPLWAFGLLFVVAGVVALLIWVSWRDRTVDFLHDVPLGVDAEAARERLLDREVPALVAADFRSVADVAHTTILERRWIPGWAFWIAILFFPIGLIALLARNRETVTVSSSGGSLRINGSCSKPIADTLIEAADQVAAEIRSI